MRGIISYGAYIPPYRLKRAAIHEALNGPVSKGTRAVAAYDQDSTTLGWEAARLALADTSATELDILSFSTATPAYLDKTNATALHAALGLSEAVLAFDSGGALRSGLGTLVANFRGCDNILTVMADLRNGRPGSDEESAGGDAAAAFLVGNGSEVIAEFVGSSSLTKEFMDRWRLPGQATSQVWEERFGEFVYADLMQKLMTEGLSRAGVNWEDIDRIVLTGSHARAVRTAQRKMGARVISDLTDVVGQSGLAHVGVLLASALDRAAPDELIAIINLADGVDIVVLRTTKAIENYAPPFPIADQLDVHQEIGYTTFLTWRGFLERQPPRRPDLVRPAAPPSYRNEKWKFGLVGSQDRSSAAVHLPPQRVSFSNAAVDDMLLAPRANSRGTVATYTVDHLAFTPSPPMIPVVIDFDDGGRFVAELTDCVPDDVKIGMHVEMTFRRLFTANGIHNYFWKARPLRAEEH